MKFSVFLLTLALLVSAQVPTFDPAKPVSLSNGVELKVLASASPTMADWDSDGFDDLLVGEVIDQGSQSKIRLYLGTGSPPVFLDFVYLQADDSDIVIPACNY